MGKTSVQLMFDKVLVHAGAKKDTLRRKKSCPPPPPLWQEENALAKKQSKITMNPNTKKTTCQSHDITRRNFMKKSVFAAGTVAILGQGVGLAHLTDNTSCINVCNSWTTATSTLYTDNVDGSGPVYQVGYCHCLNGHRRQSYKMYPNYTGKGRYLSPQDKAPWNFLHNGTGHLF